MLPQLPSVPGGRLKRLVRLLVLAHAFAKEVYTCVGRYPLRDVLLALRHGFVADRIYLYGRSGVLSGEYLSDVQRQFSRFINPKPVRELLEDKLLFATLASRWVNVPTNYLYSCNNRCVVLTDDWWKLVQCNDTSRVYRFVLKRARGGGGTDISLAELCNGRIKIHNEIMDLSRFYRFFSDADEYLLCQFIEQCDFCRKIYPHATNTLRLICMRDNEGEPFIAKAVLRIGTSKSKGVDNFGQGGLAANVSLETGQLNVAVEHDVSGPNPPSRYQRHPDTGILIQGERLPRWPDSRSAALSLMQRLPFIHYVGWDIVLTGAGPVFLEGNNYTGVRLAQIHSGLLKDDRIRDFYVRHGIVTPEEFTRMRNRRRRHH
jgi:hypothetical protein